MTRLPTESRNVVGVEAEPYELNLICAKPGCSSRFADPHHLWRRSETIGPYWWVHIVDDDVIVGNVVGLCRVHHDQVTVNAAWISWENGHFTWTDLTTASQPLSFQPPVRQVGLAPEPISNHPEKNGAEPADGSLPLANADGSCPTCLRPLPHPKTEREMKRERRTWSVTVPKDEREDGAQAIDTLLEEGRIEMARAGLPYGTEDTAKFFVLSTLLALFVQHAAEILSDA